MKTAILCHMLQIYQPAIILRIICTTRINLAEISSSPVCHHPFFIFCQDKLICIKISPVISHTRKLFYWCNRNTARPLPAKSATLWEGHSMWFDLLSWVWNTATHVSNESPKTKVPSSKTVRSQHPKNAYSWTFTQRKELMFSLIMCLDCSHQQKWLVTLNIIKGRWDQHITAALLQQSRCDSRKAKEIYNNQILSIQRLAHDNFRLQSLL